MEDAEVDKQEPGGVEDDIGIRGGTRPADEEFAPTDEAVVINFGGPGFSG